MSGCCGLGADAKGDVRLAVFELQDPVAADQACRDLRVVRLEGGDQRQDERCEHVERGHRQLSGEPVRTALGDALKLTELCVGGLRDPQEFPPELRRREAAGVPLEELGAERGFQCIDVARHRGPVHAQSL